MGQGACVRADAGRGRDRLIEYSRRFLPVHVEIAHEFDIPLDALELAVISPDLVDKFVGTVRKLGNVGIEG